ncbi:MAG: 50S ribosomal protein L9 [Dehalococcoidales bacterium]|nr:MAG: 50S ribosomal protein L9 [Dehalococcoidales bacterium]
MKVIFLENVPNVARIGEIKEVADGYGRNYLIPRQLALLASPEVIERVEVKLKAKARIQAETEAELLEMAGHLEGREVIIEARTGGKDRLYGSITAADIATAIENTIGLVIDKRKIELEQSIREIGSHEVVIRLAGDIVPKITVTVIEQAT